jgi:UDP-glucose 4-epimerase
MLLVTGGSGFVGARVVARARERGLAVRALSRRAATGIDHAADLADAAALDAVPLEDVTEVIHCAAAVPSRSHGFARDNVQAAATLAYALRRARGLRRVIHVSSVSVYAAPSSGVWLLDEQAAVVDGAAAESPSYAQSKWRAEQELDRLASTETVIAHLRASSIYGPGMKPTTLLPVLVSRARAGEPLVLRGPRGYVQNFIHVDDVADLALAAAASASVTPSIVNAFSEDTLGIFDLAELVRQRLGSASSVVDETSTAAVPTPRFVNLRARALLPVFRALRDHLDEAA